jgi:hypothetical protein
MTPEDETDTDLARRFVMQSVEDRLHDLAPTSFAPFAAPAARIKYHRKPKR